MEKCLRYKHSELFKNPNADVDCHWFYGSSTLHLHDYCELFIVTQNQVVHNYLHKETTLQKLEGVFIQPYKRHHISAQPHAQHFNISFTKTLLEKICNLLDPEFYTILLSEKSDFKFSVSENQVEDFLALQNSISTPQVFNAQIITILFQLLSKCYVKYKQNNQQLYQAHYPEWLCLFIQEITKPENFTMKLSDFYKLVPYSQTSLLTKFKQFTGKTLLQFINEQKIEYAKGLLHKTNFSILQISSMLWFDSLSYFTNLFKKMTGVTPTIYRKKSYCYD